MMDHYIFDRNGELDNISQLEYLHILHQCILKNACYFFAILLPNHKVSIFGIVS